MRLLNTALGKLFDILLMPFAGLPAAVGLAVVSLLTAIGMLLVFKATSNQPAIDAVKRRIHAGLFEMRLFNDDLRAVGRAQLEILRANVTYFRLSLIPMLWMIVPLALIVAQLQAHYGYSGLRTGESAIVSVALGEGFAGKDDDKSTRPQITLEVPSGLRLESPAVWLPAKDEVAWRLVADAPGEYELSVGVAAETHAKTLLVSEGHARRSPLRAGGGFLDQLLYPSEDPLPAASSIRRVTVAYDEASVSLLGWSMHWIIAFLALTLVFAFALRNKLGVKI